MNPHQKLDNYLYTLDVCKKLLTGTHPAHYERLSEMERLLKKWLKT